jgi:hypothetical protein
LLSNFKTLEPLEQKEWNLNIELSKYWKGFHVLTVYYSIGFTELALELSGKLAKVGVGC